MRVRLTPEEARSFVADMFQPEFVNGNVVDMADAGCDAPFWPLAFDRPAMAYDTDRASGETDRASGFVPLKTGSQGAVYQDGYLYFWSNAT